MHGGYDGLVGYDTVVHRCRCGLASLRSHSPPADRCRDPIHSNPAHTQSNHSLTRWCGLLLLLFVVLWMLSVDWSCGHAGDRIGTVRTGRRVAPRGAGSYGRGLRRRLDSGRCRPFVRRSGVQCGGPAGFHVGSGRPRDLLSLRLLLAPAGRAPAAQRVEPAGARGVGVDERQIRAVSVPAEHSQTARGGRHQVHQRSLDAHSNTDRQTAGQLPSRECCSLCLHPTHHRFLSLRWFVLRVFYSYDCCCCQASWTWSAPADRPAR